MLVLVINSGSSSIKYKLYDVHKDVFLAEGVVEKIGSPSPRHVHEYNGMGPIKRKVEACDHQCAIKLILDILVDKDIAVVKALDEITAVGHRVVHGGEEFNKSVVIDEHVIDSITRFARLAPLHNPPALAGIKATKKMLPSKPQVAVFDTAFHQTMPEKAYIYALPYRLYRKYKIRRYGFHGTSHK
ncbi:MAG: acetate kinase, partial [Candidatus Omnitrophica bacterium]|nr:acetate kinase [Candidatus Omnitrophota bacterium]